jgi:hypothetical protein
VYLLYLRTSANWREPDIGGVIIRRNKCNSSRPIDDRVRLQIRNGHVVERLTTRAPGARAATSWLVDKFPTSAGVNFPALP